MIPSQRVYGGLGVGLGVAWLTATLAGLPWGFVTLLIWDLALLGLVWQDYRQMQPLVVQRHPLGRLSVNRENPVTLTLQATAPATHYPLQAEIRDGWPGEFRVAHRVLTCQFNDPQVQTLTYAVVPLRRGEFAWGGLSVRQRSPRGWVWRQWQVEQHQTVTVYPDLMQLQSLSIRLTLEASGSLRQRQWRGMGTEFAELRDYTRGDDPRLMDWKATARRQRPLVRVLEPEQEQTLILLLDQGRLMTAQVEALTRFDWALNAALGLALAALKRGDRVGVGLFDRHLHTWIPPQRDPTHLNRLIEVLSPLQPRFLEPDYVAAVTGLVQRQSRRALVVMMTDVIDSTASGELLAALGHLTSRHLPFCVALRDPQLNRVAAQPITPHLPTAYQTAVALDLLAQRQAALAHLHQKGVLVLDAPASQISEPLIDQYLHLKRRHQL
ncbi:MAG: DUF58 domain-containing protein [Cyanobacteriota bacterium]|nr:DUF58 domain-containing protein [Cyanobacteriota bacterium]